jgi:hypothetical protein
LGANKHICSVPDSHKEDNFRTIPEIPSNVVSEQHFPFIGAVLMTISTLEFILKILAFWTLASFIGGAILCYLITVSKRGTANHLPPLPEGSILGKRRTRAF